MAEIALLFASVLSGTFVPAAIAAFLGGRVQCHGTVSGQRRSVLDCRARTVAFHARQVK